MKVPSICVVLALIAVVGASASQAQEYAELTEDGAMVEPIVELQVDEARGGRGAAAKLSRSVSGAKSMSSVKNAMKATMKRAVAAKKTQLAKAAKAATKDARENGAKKAKKANKTAMYRVKKQNAKAKTASRGAAARAENAKEHLAKAIAKRKAAQAKVNSFSLKRGKSKTAAIHARKLAEEAAKVATAKRIAAEEDAKRHAAMKVRAEEDAKRAAAERLASRESAQSVKRSRGQLLTMEAAALKAAAGLKIKEASALRSAAGREKRTERKVRVKKLVAKEGSLEQKLRTAKGHLKVVSTAASRTLRRAEAKPMSKTALAAVVTKRRALKGARKEVARLQGLLGRDKIKVKNLKVKSMKVKKVKKLKKVKMSSLKSKIGGRVAKVKASRHKKKYSLKHPNLKHMSKKQIKYWSSKKRMKKIYRSVDPMKKTRVMQRIFAMKEREAETLRKMNELNTRIGMKTSGVRAALMRKGMTAIVNGELIKPKANFHLKHTFQGQKSKDPRTSVPIRDPKQDRRKKLTLNGLQKKMASVMARNSKQASEARAALVNVGKPIGMRQGRLKIADLKKSVKANAKRIGRGGRSSTFSMNSSNRGGNNELGDDNEESESEMDDERAEDDVKADDAQDDQLMAKEDEGAEDDDSDVDIVEDSLGMDDIDGRRD